METSTIKNYAAKMSTVPSLGNPAQSRISYAQCLAQCLEYSEHAICNFLINEFVKRYICIMDK